MKRLLSTVLVLCVLVISAMATGVLDIDLSKMTDDEVIALSALVNEEIVKRNIEKTASLPQGKYVVGEDLPAGKYVCEFVEEDGLAIIWISILETDEDILQKLLHPKESILITLEEGQYLTINNDLLLTVSSGIKFN